MAQKLDANLNVIQETPIELELINGDLNIISKLDDEPNDVGGLTSTQLKAKFDEAGNIIKEYLNESLIPAVLAADATEATRSAAEAERVENEVERVANENVRVPAETARIAAENIRIENEATRVASEEERIDAEAIRKSNEAQRIANENAREDLETGYVARAEAAAKRAEDAAADAENAVGGDYVTQEELDAAIGAIPTPNVYTKTETLTNDTKGLFGLGSGAVPNDVFGVLSKGVTLKTTTEYGDVLTDVLGNTLALNANQIAGSARIAYGSYAGTDTYGANNPCVANLGFKPFMFIWVRLTDNGHQSFALKHPASATADDYRVWYEGFNTIVLANNATLNVTATDTALSWYSTVSASNQFNYGQRDYAWIAFG